MLATILVLLAVLLSRSAVAEEPPAAVESDSAITDPPAMFVVDVELVEVQMTRLRDQGLSLHCLATATSTTRTSELGVPNANELAAIKGDLADQLLKNLKERNWMKTFAHPKVMTLSGEPASMFVGEHVGSPPVKAGLELDAIPVPLDNHRVRVAIRIELSDANLAAPADSDEQPIVAIQAKRIEAVIEARLDQTLIIPGATEVRTEAVQLADGSVVERSVEVATWAVVMVSAAAAPQR